MPVRFFRTGITVNLPCRLRDTWSQEIENIPEIVQRLMVIAGACGTSALMKGMSGIPASSSRGRHNLMFEDEFPVGPPRDFSVVPWQFWLPCFAFPQNFFLFLKSAIRAFSLIMPKVYFSFSRFPV